MHRSTLFPAGTVVKIGFEYVIPPNIKTVEQANAYFTKLGKEAEMLSQKVISEFYNSLSSEDQKKFIWENGIKPDFKKENPKEEGFLTALFSRMTS